MATYYVRTTGNDSTGTGATGAPWLTLTKALASVSAGDTVLIGDGTYAESNFWSITRVFASDVTFQSESGVAANVVIQGSSNATHNTLLSAGATHYAFVNLTFAMRVGTTAYPVRLSEAHYVTFTGCRFVVTSDASGTKRGCALLPSASVTVDHVTFTGCTFTQTGTSAAYGLSAECAATNPVQSVTVTSCDASGMKTAGIYATGPVTGLVVTGGTFAGAGDSGITVTGTSAVAPATGVAISGVTATGANGIYLRYCTSPTITNCTTSGTAEGLHVQDTTGVVVTGGTYTGGTNHGLCLGVDGESGGTVTGSVVGPTIVNATTGHGLLIGAGCTGVAVSACTVTGGDYAIVAKECTGCTFTGCSATGHTYAGAAAAGAVYFKAAVNCSITRSTLACDAYQTSLIGINSVSGHTCSGITITDCTLTASGSANLVNYSGTTITSDRNAYTLSGSGNWGTANGTSGIASLAALRTAWSGYTPSGNDANSRTF